MSKSFPPDVIVLDTDGLLHARLARGKKGPRIVQAKAYRLADGTFTPSMVTPQLANEAGLAEALRRLRAETGKWENVSLLLPDSWFRMNIWNAITVREAATTADRLFVYVREEDFTTAVFRGAQPLFIRSRNLSGDRTLEQELRLSASYLRESLGTEGFANCYVAGVHAGADVAAALAAEFNTQVRTLQLRDYVEESPADLQGRGAELAEGAFSWSTLLDELESVMPQDVRLVSVAPSFSPDGTIALVLNFEAKGPTGMITTINRMNADPQFSNAFPDNEQLQQSGTYVFNLHATYTPPAALRAAK